MSVLALSASFEYLYVIGPRPLYIFFFSPHGDRLQTSLTSEEGPPGERIIDGTYLQLETNDKNNSLCGAVEVHVVVFMSKISQCNILKK